jgi:hypothetical protein
MSGLQHRSVWFGRVVLGGAALLMSRISVEYLVDPAAAVAPHQIALGSAEALTMMRVSGSLFLGIALALVTCLVSDRRLQAGLGLLAIVATTITAVRLVGVVVDGPAPFTLKVLKPEIVLVVLSTAAFLIERRRSRGGGATEVSTVASAHARPERA